MTDCEAAVGAAFGAVTTRVPVVVRLPFPWQLAPLPAVTVKLYVPGCVLPPTGPVFVVVIANAEDTFAVVMVRLFGVKVAVVPSGAGPVYAKPIVIVHALLLPPTPTVAV